MTIITEAGLYQVIMNAKSERVKPFKRWVTHEVLPQIRQTGCYVPTHRVPNRREMREDLVAVLDVADFASVNVGELAKLYNNKHITTTVINRFLTDGGYQVPISKRKFAKTAISKDIATEKKALTGDTAGRKYITGWRKTNELMSYLNSCVQKYLKQI